MKAYIFSFIFNFFEVPFFKKFTKLKFWEVIFLKYLVQATFMFVSNIWGLIWRVWPHYLIWQKKIEENLNVDEFVKKK